MAAPLARQLLLGPAKLRLLARAWPPPPPAPLTATSKRSFHNPSRPQKAQSQSAGSKTRPIGPATATLLASGSLVSFFVAVSPGFTPRHDEPPPPSGSEAGSDGRDPTLPRYRLSDVRKHDAHSSEPWVTSGDKVYDITDWIAAHPGGDVILRAAGGSIDPYWDIFTIHKSAHVYEILAQYLIGYVHSADLVDGKPAAEDVEDPFENDPARDARLITHTARPCNAEPPSKELGQGFITPNELFYVRNHMWVPVVEEDVAKQHTLSIELLDGDVRTYTLDELQKRFKRYKVTAALQCSGNRRNDMTRHAATTNGLQWGAGAISNAVWEGVKLVDVLADAGFSTSSHSADAQPSADDSPTNPNTLHVQFSGLEAYGASIPLTSALDPRADVLLAFAMNGHPLPRDHGFPLRVVVPGHVAARSVKWLSKIVIADEESPSQWQRRDYKAFGPNEGASPDWGRYPAIQEMPVTSAITSVRMGECVRRAARETSRRALGQEEQAKVPCSNRAESGAKDPAAWQAAHLPPALAAQAEPVAVAGYAYSGGGRAIVRVDVSVDGGRTWDQAELLPPSASPAGGGKHWAWTRWRYAGLLPQFRHDERGGAKEDGAGGRGEGQCVEVLAKATDEAYNTQPEHHASIYNVRGNLATAWHRVRVCPTCEAGEGGKKVWRTGEGVYGCGFGAEKEEGKKTWVETGKGD